MTLDELKQSLRDKDPALHTELFNKWVTDGFTGLTRREMGDLEFEEVLALTNLNDPKSHGKTT
jgi:hypothetical protein